MPCSKFLGNHHWVLSDGPIESRAISAAFAGRMLLMLCISPSTRFSQASSSAASGSMCLPWLSSIYIAVSVKKNHLLWGAKTPLAPPRRAGQS